MISVLIDDLAFVDADAIARPVNGLLRAITPVMRRLEIAAGEKLRANCITAEELEIGSAIVTGAGEARAELMIHAIVSTETQSVSREGVRRATLSSLQRAADWQIAHLAVAPFGLGAGNLDVEGSSDAMMAAIREHRRRSPNPSRLTIVVENELEAEVFRFAASRIEEPE
jgi:O-acetyl-ADP-ribose deacetylase (regulator of RNase III)